MNNTETINPKCIKLERVMTEVVYPKLFDLMEHNDLKNIVIKLKGANDLTISNNRKLCWEKPDIARDNQWTEIKPELDPVFRSYTTKMAYTQVKMICTSRTVML